MTIHPFFKSASHFSRPTLLPDNIRQSVISIIASLLGTANCYAKARVTVTLYRPLAMLDYSDISSQTSRNINTDFAGTWNGDIEGSGRERSTAEAATPEEITISDVEEISFHEVSALIKLVDPNGYRHQLLTLIQNNRSKIVQRIFCFSLHRWKSTL